MGKFWIVILFLCVFLICSNIVKRFMLRFINSAENSEAVSIITAEKDNAKIFWEKEGFRRNPSIAEFELPEKDFFENENTELSEDLEEEFKNLSDDEVEKILEESGLLKREGEE